LHPKEAEYGAATNFVSQASVTRRATGRAFG